MLELGIYVVSVEWLGTTTSKRRKNRFDGQGFESLVHICPSFTNPLFYPKGYLYYNHSLGYEHASVIIVYR